MITTTLLLTAAAIVAFGVLSFPFQKDGEKAAACTGFAFLGAAILFFVAAITYQVRL